MIIGIDGNEANIEKKVGISEYAFELLREFKNLKSQFSNLKFSIYLKDPPRKELPKTDENWGYKIVGPKKFWTQIGLPFNLYFNKPRPDVFFSPTHYAPRFCPVPTVVSVMDLSYIFYPEMFNKKDLYQLKSWTQYSVEKAKKVLTISNASRNDIIKQYKLDQKKVVVTHLGLKPTEGKNDMGVDKKYGIDGEYILFVGTLQPRKNIIRLIEAFSKLNEKKIELVIAGKKGWMFDEILETPEKLGIKDKVKFLEFVPNEDLPSLYSKALCFVLPSLYEGFGLPVLEAMANKCPVITSNVSSLPEAGGDAALYVDPENVGDIVAKMEKVISDGKLREQMIKKGLEQVKKFSWEKTAKETLSVLEEIAKNG